MDILQALGWATAQESRRAQQAFSRVVARSALRCRPDNRPQPPWSSAHRHALVGAPSVHSSPKWLDANHAAQHAPALPAYAVASADAVHRVGFWGLLAPASLSWLAAIVFALWWTMQISNATRALWITPGIIWEDFRQPPKTASFPITQRTAKETALLMLGVIFGSAWIITFGLSLFWNLSKWYPLAEEFAFLGLTLFHNGALLESVRQRLRTHCIHPEQRQAWLAFFERKHPNLTRLRPLVMENTARVLGIVVLALSPSLPVLLEAALSGWAAIAFHILMLILTAMVVGILLTHWAGVIVGGRYAWWVEYHMINADLSTG
ncbi:hypothetical protein AB4090_14590 [Acidithiobacillus sp. IBUN Pt1247-S3]|uniref:hypothetical protein n=1 Tax=Acidithiobacillus sp. IBUN Pt1247-S3 TaxID=3166642 RepID=UPI0034E3BC98